MWNRSIFSVRSLTLPALTMLALVAGTIASPRGVTMACGQGYVPPGFDMAGSNPIDPNTTVIPPGFDMAGSNPVDPNTTVIPPGYDLRGGQAVDPNAPEAPSNDCNGNCSGGQSNGCTGSNCDGGGCPG
jgi:hypothetical protein